MQFFKELHAKSEAFKGFLINVQFNRENQTQVFDSIGKVREIV
jgi:hypothetical protein